MSQNNPRPGFSHVAEYQVSGLPHVQSGSVTVAACIPFHHVSRAVTVTNNSSAGTFLLIGFTQNGVNGSNCFPLDGGKQQRFEVRVRDLWLRGQADAAVNYGLLAELTPIERRMMLPLTGSIDTSTYAGQLAATGSILWHGVG